MEADEMKDGKAPDPNTVHPITGYDKEIYVKPTVKNPTLLSSAIYNRQDCKGPVFV